MTRIVFLLGSAYPSPKAYSITTFSMATAFEKLDLDVEIYSYSSNYRESKYGRSKSKIKYFQISNSIKVIRKYALSNSGKTHQIAFMLSHLIVMLMNRKIMEVSKKDKVITRDLITFLAATVLFEADIFFEIHDSLGKIKAKILKYIFGKNNVFLLPTTTAIANDLLKYRLVNFMVAPVGIDIEEMEKHIFNSKASRALFSVGYVGKFTSSGIQKGITDLVDLAEYFQKKNFSGYVHLVGANDNEMAQMNDLVGSRKIDKKYIQITQHVPHSDALDFIANFDAVVLTKFESAKYKGIPLKAMEICYLANRIIVAESESNRAIFNDLDVPFWYVQGDSSSLFDAVSQSKVCLNLASRQELARNIAIKNSWDNRAKNILKMGSEIV
jgi:hypothetical protein